MLKIMYMYDIILPNDPKFIKTMALISCAVMEQLIYDLHQKHNVYCRCHDPGYFLKFGALEADSRQ